MPALASDIALYTTDGIVVTSPADPAVAEAIAAAHIDARSGEDREIEMFYDSAADAQAMLDERFSYLSKVNPAHIGIEVEEALDMGGAIALTPSVPTFQVVDSVLGVNVAARTRAYAHDMNTDRFSVEVLA